MSGVRTQRGKEEIQAHENTKARERGKLSAREHEGDNGKTCARKQERGRKHSGALEHGGQARTQRARSMFSSVSIAKKAGAAAVYFSVLPVRSP